MLNIKYSEEVENKMRVFFDSLNEKDRRGYAGIGVPRKLIYASVIDA